LLLRCTDDDVLYARRYYSLFTLGMLVMFECTVVFQRQRNLRELRSLQTPKQRLQAYRGGKWEVRRRVFKIAVTCESKANGSFAGGAHGGAAAWWY
jgi:hypothetical protein